MPLNHNISYSSPEFFALVNNDFEYVVKNFDKYSTYKDHWLTVASCYSNLSINDFFVSQGSNPNFNGSENFTNAIYQNNLELVKFYVSHKCILFGTDSDHLGGAVMGAVNHDNLEMLKYLIDLGCDIHLDNDYAFNRGIAENSIHCIKYLIQYGMTYTPKSDETDYNIQQIIEKNYYQIFDYILDLIPKPLLFNFPNSINNLLSKGSPELFEVFVKYELINESSFINSFSSIYYFFPNQQNLYNYLEKNYSTWFLKSINKEIDEKKLESLLSFTVSQQDRIREENITLTTTLLDKMKEVPFINKFLESHPTKISEILLRNVDNKNNLELLIDNFHPTFINDNKIQIILDDILPTLIEKEYFPQLLEVIFKLPCITNLETLNKIYSYYKLNSNSKFRISYKEKILPYKTKKI